MNETANALKQIDTLLEDFSQQSSPHEGRKVLELHTRLVALIDRLTLPNSAYRRQAAMITTPTAHRAVASYKSQVQSLGALVQGLRADISDGFLYSVSELLHADTFAHFLEMAEELVEKGYKDPAAVLAGAVLESHLRMLCGKFGVTATDSNGQPHKAERMNVDLVKADVYNKLEQKSVTADLGLRNAAAHGKFDEYEKEAVKMMIARVTDFISKHPA